MKNIRNLISYKKGYTDFGRQTPPFPQNGYCPPTNGFSQLFLENTAFFEKLV